MAPAYMDLGGTQRRWMIDLHFSSVGMGWGTGMCGWDRIMRDDWDGLGWDTQLTNPWLHSPSAHFVLGC